MSGAQLLARLLQEKVNMPRIVVSDIVSLEVRNRAIALGGERSAQEAAGRRSSAPRSAQGRRRPARS